jgi:molybdate transport system substrate-binding protein
MRYSPLILAALLAGLCAGCGGSESQAVRERSAEGSGGQITIAAASDLRPAFTKLRAEFNRRTGTHVAFSFGSSGQLAQQIVNGAPFDLFASADVGFVDQVIEAGRGAPETKATYAFGRIVVWSPDRRYTLNDLADPSLRTVAIANPDHAPYGRAAREALKRMTRWQAVEPKLVIGENVSDTQRLARSGNADAAVVALSLALASEGEWSRVPARLHEPLEQALVVTGEGDEGQRAREFAGFVDSRDGRTVMRRYGFLLPGEQLPE